MGLSLNQGLLKFDSICIFGKSLILQKGNINVSHICSSLQVLFCRCSKREKCEDDGDHELVDFDETYEHTRSSFIAWRDQQEETLLVAEYRVSYNIPRHCVYGYFAGHIRSRR